MTRIPAGLVVYHKPMIAPTSLGRWTSRIRLNGIGLVTLQVQMCKNQERSLKVPISRCNGFGDSEAKVRVKCQGILRKRVRYNSRFLFINFSNRTAYYILGSVKTNGDKRPGHDFSSRSWEN